MVISRAGVQALPGLDAAVRGQVLTPRVQSLWGDRDIDSSPNSTELFLTRLVPALRKFPFQCVKTDKGNPIVKPCAKGYK